MMLALRVERWGNFPPDYSMRLQSATSYRMWQIVFSKDGWNNTSHPTCSTYNDIDYLPIRKLGRWPLPLNLDGLVFQC